MRKVIFICALLCTVGGTSIVKSQVSVHVDVALQPRWGLAGHSYVQYYYFPEIDSYYDVAGKRFIYYHNRKWVRHKKLPKHYKHLDLYRTPKIVVNRSEPWREHRHGKGHYKGHGKYGKHYRGHGKRDYHGKNGHKKHKHRKYD